MNHTITPDQAKQEKSLDTIRRNNHQWVEGRGNTEGYNLKPPSRLDLVLAGLGIVALVIFAASI